LRLIWSNVVSSSKIWPPLPMSLMTARAHKPWHEPIEDQVQSRQGAGYVVRAHPNASLPRDAYLSVNVA
jgi:hypothetical protein